MTLDQARRYLRRRKVAMFSVAVLLVAIVVARGASLALHGLAVRDCREALVVDHAQIHGARALAAGLTELARPLGMAPLGPNASIVPTERAVFVSGALVADACEDAP